MLKGGLFACLDTLKRPKKVRQTVFRVSAESDGGGVDEGRQEAMALV